MRPEIYVKQGPLTVGTVQNNESLFAAGDDSSVVVLADGSVKAFGDYQVGTSNTPVVVPGVAGMSAVSAGRDHSLALATDGKVRSWGINTKGQLGNNAPASKAPRDVLGLPNSSVTTTQVATGREHSLALSSDGRVWAWGDNVWGQFGFVGLPVTSNSFIPWHVRNGLPGDIVAIAAGHYHNVAIDRAGQLWAWGKNDTSQTGAKNSPTSWSKPELVSLLPGSSAPQFIAIAAGERFSLALDSTGQVWGWGSNAYGQLAVNPKTVSRRGTAEKLVDLPAIKAIAAGASHALALSIDGTVYAWGQNFDKQLGAAGANQFKPTAVPELKDVVAISANGGYHNLAATADGKVYSWGRNKDGQLGLGDTSTTAHDKAEPIASLTLPIATRPAPGATTFDPEEEKTTGPALLFSIENWGLGELKLTGSPLVELVDDDGDGQQDFVLSTPPKDSALASAKTTTFEVSFAPQSTGVKKAKLVIKSNDLDTATYEISITGEGISGDRYQVIDNATSASITASTPQAPSVQTWGKVDAETPRYFTVRNMGTKPLKITAVKLSSTTDFALPGLSVPSTLAAGQAYGFTVVFRPTGNSGLRTTTVTIETDAGKQKTFSFNVEAEHTARPRIEVFESGQPVVGSPGTELEFAL